MQDSKGKLKIKWQRLLSDGETCERCQSTEREVEKAVRKLKETLPRLGIKVKLEKEKLTEEEFKKNPKASNRIFIGDKPLEELIGANVGGSKCCDVCGEEECRTVIIGGEEHEVVPSQTIINAALNAAQDQLPTDNCCTSPREEDTCCS
ncbi:hypothetical protein AKJ65_07955 [candidate division MSBL1 archaeon SCGC-AAA259E19]|uniref:Heavy metal sensor signal transduction histidine kinase n=1 Tax=candidate division MSBL1 archaeon SCGC-AAA259E19 TaxID=1698264 RepID=A0A133UDB2_9EURY|nr:hypothetical protein AKJ65_07955 [candidate division MSBL1 archaeon SCGC-AAA259E19]